MSQDRPEIGSPLLRDLFVYWDSGRNGRPFPRRSDIDPIDIPRLLPHVFLVNVERGEGLRFRVRLAGTYVEAAFQQFTTGRYLEEIKLNGQTDDILARYSECAQTGIPVLSRHVFVNEDHRSFDYQRLLLPLAVDDDTRVDMIFGGICFAAPLPTPLVLPGATKPSMERGAYA
jgi:hypothetical protein